MTFPLVFCSPITLLRFLKHALFQLFVEDGRKIHQTYGSDPVRIQLGVGMTIPGLDKGLIGVCKQELRKIQIPYRLAQRGKSKGESQLFIFGK